MTPDISAIALKHANEYAGIPMPPSLLARVILDAIEEATSSLRAQLEQRWIPVSEKLPPTSDSILAVITDEFSEYRKVRIAHYAEHLKEWFGIQAWERVTHWMPLPASPQVAPESPLNGEKLETGKQ